MLKNSTGKLHTVLFPVEKHCQQSLQGKKTKWAVEFLWFFELNKKLDVLYLGVDERDAVLVAGEGTHGARIGLRETAPVPHLAESVVSCREDDMRRLVVQGHGIRIILVGIYLQHNSSSYVIAKREEKCIYL